MKPILRTAAVIILLSTAPAALAQGGMRGPRPIADVYAGMSPAGRQIMSEAMMQGRDQGARDRLVAAHERVLAILEQDPLDRAALADAMKAQAEIVDQLEARRREAMLRGFSRLSAADRKAWATNERAMRRQGGRGMQQGAIP